MVAILAVLGFGLIAIGGLIGFGICKVHGLWKNVFLLNSKDSIEPCKDRTPCETLKEMNEHYLERRNEFWQGLGQFTIIIVIITLLVVLLLMDKISSEAAVPLIAGLGSFSLGKGVASIKNNSTSGNPPWLRKDDKQGAG